MTYILVHGGGFSGSCWNELRPFLNGSSYAVDLPGRGGTPGDLAGITFADFAASVAAEIVESDLDAVTLVGHSMAGLTLPRVAELIPARLRHLVFVSCAVPAQGLSLLEVLGGFGPTTKAITERLGSEAVDKEGVLHPDLATAMFCNDMDESQIASTLDRLVPESFSVLSDPADLTGLGHDIPRTYIRLLRDAAISLDMQNQMIENLGEVAVMGLDAGHMAMITRPRELADLINGL
jgi:pimeloyl-ACP methyl ester carboxylesterase